MEKINLLKSDCPMQLIISRLCNKWAVMILFALNRDNTLRFNELEKIIPEISPKVLTSTLRILEEDGVISRQIFPQVPPKVEYSINEKGCFFLTKLIDFLCITGEELHKKCNL